MKKAIFETFESVDREILQRFHAGGSTAVCVLIKRDMMYLMNVGDSIGAVIRENNAMQISDVHSANREEERRLITERGGVVIPHNDIYRVQGSLAVSRSFGDKSYKPFITAIPDFKEFELTGRDQLLLLGSDGFWNAMTLDQVHEYVKDLRVNQSENYDVKSLSAALMKQAAMKMRDKRKDNMTLLVVDLQAVLKATSTPVSKEKRFEEIPVDNSRALKKSSAQGRRSGFFDSCIDRSPNNNTKDEWTLSDETRRRNTTV